MPETIRRDATTTVDRGIGWVDSIVVEEEYFLRHFHREAQLSVHPLMFSSQLVAAGIFYIISSPQMIRRNLS